jgi:hypothetical protein
MCLAARHIGANIKFLSAVDIFERSEYGYLCFVRIYKFLKSGPICDLSVSFGITIYTTELALGKHCVLTLFCGLFRQLCPSA